MAEDNNRWLQNEKDRRVFRTEDRHRSVLKIAKELCDRLHEDHLVFCSTSEYCPFINQLNRLDDTVVGKFLQTHFDQLVVLDVKSGLVEDEVGSRFDISKFYIHINRRFQQVFDIELDVGFHEQDILQTLKDEQDALICILNVHVASTSEQRNLRCLTQESHRALVHFVGETHLRSASIKLIYEDSRLKDRQVEFGPFDLPCRIENRLLKKKSIPFDVCEFDFEFFINDVEVLIVNHLDSKLAKDNSSVDKGEAVKVLPGDRIFLDIEISFQVFFSTHIMTDRTHEFSDDEKPDVFEPFELSEDVPSDFAPVQFALNVKNAANKKSKSYFFEKNSLSVGSANFCDILLEDAGVSKIHAQIYVKFARVFVKDCYSKTGICIDNERISPGKPYLINHRDTILIGNSEFVLHIYD